MKHHVRTLTCGVALIAAIGCGGKQTMASKSAAAFDEAKKKGIPIATGEHGGHSNEEPAAAATETDHAAMPGMDHSTMTGMDHSAMAGMDHSKMSAADHAHMSGMDHTAMAGMDHSTMDHSTDHTKMDHAKMDHAEMIGMQHGSPATAPLVIAPPTSNAAIAQTQPAATLRPDDFDAPAPAAIDEAAKAAAPPPGHHHENGGAS